MTYEVMNAFKGSILKSKFKDGEVIIRVNYVNASDKDLRFRGLVLWSSVKSQTALIDILPEDIIHNFGQLDIINSEQFLEQFPEYAI